MKEKDRLINTFLEKYLASDPKIFKPIRLIILLLNYIYPDGIQFRELLSTLKVSDGKLLADLKVLIDLGYIEKNSTKIDNKELDFYIISEKGKKIFNEIRTVLKLFIELIPNED